MADPFSALIGGIFDIFSTDSTNDTNVQLAREQRAWDEKMWNKQNEYNSPTAQMQRYQDAGINPYMAMGQISPGIASQSAGGQSPPVVQKPNEAPSAFAQFADQMFQRELMEANVRKANAEADAAENTSEGIAWQNMFNSQAFPYFLQDAKSRSELSKYSSDYTFRTLEDLIQQAHNNTSISEYNMGIAHNQLRQSAIAAVISEDFDYKFSQKNYEVLQNILDKGLIEVKNLEASGRLTEAQIRKVVADTYFTVAQTLEIKSMLPYKINQAQADIKSSSWRNLLFRESYTRMGIDNNVANMIQDFLINGASLSNDFQRSQNFSIGYDNFFKPLGTASSVFNGFGFKKDNNRR